MIRTQFALLQRELWEHRSIYVAPLVIALLIALLSITGQVAVSAFGQEVDLTIIGLSNLGANERAAAIGVVTSGIALMLMMSMAVLSVFYLLDTLYTERRDKSILFWRSLPVTDAETVISKLATAVLVIPLVTFVVVVLTQIFVLSVSSMWISGRGGDGWSLIWQSAPLFQNWLGTLVFFLAVPLWFVPYAGWFLFVSAWTRRSPFLVAILPLLVVPMVERIVVGTSFFRDAIFGRFTTMPLFKGLDGAGIVFGDDQPPALEADARVTLITLIDLPKYLSDPALWIGLVVGGLFTAAAIYVRRYRDES
jgi:ABC-2 type transport system permease protein